MKLTITINQRSVVIPAWIDCRIALFFQCPVLLGSLNLLAFNSSFFILLPLLAFKQSSFPIPPSVLHPSFFFSIYFNDSLTALLVPYWLLLPDTQPKQRPIDASIQCYYLIFMKAFALLTAVHGPVDNIYIYIYIYIQ